MNALLSFAASKAASTIVERYRQAKGTQLLDPISTICMLALRTLKENEGSKPGVHHNWFQFSSDSYWQGISRATNGLSNDDLFYLDFPIKLFTKGWKPTGNPGLVAIVNVAIEGLKLISSQYQPALKNAAPLAKAYRKRLKEWVKSQDAANAKSPTDQDFLAVRNVLDYFLRMKGLVEEEVAQQLGALKIVPPNEQQLQEAMSWLERGKKSVKQGQQVPPAIEFLEQFLQPKEAPKEVPSQQITLFLRIIEQNSASITEVNAFLNNLAEQKQAAEKPLPDEVAAFVAKINGLWPVLEVDTFGLWLADKECQASALKGVLESRRVKYLEMLETQKK